MLGLLWEVLTATLNLAMILHLARGVVAEVLEGLALTPLVAHLVAGCKV